MVAFGAPIVIALGLIGLGIASIIPFGAGLLGFSERVAIIYTAVLTGGLVILEISTFSNALRYQSLLLLILVKIGTTALLGIELLVTFLLARWLGAKCRSGFLWVRNQFF